MAYFRAGNAESTSNFDLEAISRQADAMEAQFSQRRIEAEQDLAREIEEKFREAITGSAEEDGAALAELARTAGRLNVSGLASVAEATMTRIQEIAARKAAQEGDAFDPREEIRRSERKDREEEMLRDFRQDAKQAQLQAEEAAKERREAILRDAENDNTPSSDYPGLSRGEVLRGLRIINENLPFFSQRAVDRGLIKPEERLAFEEYMRQMEWIEQQKWLRDNGHPNELDTPEGRARQQWIKDMEALNPGFRAARQDTMALANGRDGASPTSQATTASGEVREDARRQSIEAASNSSAASSLQNNSVTTNTPLQRPISVAVAEMGNGLAASTTSLTATFNPVAATTTPANMQPTQVVERTPSVVLAQGANLHAGMI